MCVCVSVLFLYWLGEQGLRAWHGLTTAKHLDTHTHTHTQKVGTILEHAQIHFIYQLKPKRGMTSVRKETEDVVHAGFTDPYQVTTTNLHRGGERERAR